MPNENFDYLNLLMGWGDPGCTAAPGLWFIGIEEAERWCCEQIAEEGIERSRARSAANNGTWENINQEIRDGWNGLGREGLSIRKGMAYISYRLTENCSENVEGAEQYRHSRMFDLGSGTFQSNLFPLGKPQASNPLPQEAMDFYGLDNMQDYKDRIGAARFRALRAFWGGKSPRAIVCFGKTRWHEFRGALGLIHEAGEIRGNGKLCVYPESRVVMTPHFSRNAFTRALQNEVVSLLQHEWGVTLPKFPPP